MPTADTNNNIIVTTYDGIATLGTDYGTSGVTANIHLPLSKIVWGNENVSRRASTEFPLPVSIRDILGGNTGATAAFSVYVLGTVTASVPGIVAITGGIKGLDVFTVGNTSENALWIRGVTGSTPVGITVGELFATIQGKTGAFPVSVTLGSPIQISNSSFGVHGISGGTALSVSVGNVVTITGGRSLSLDTDSVNVFIIGTTNTALIEKTKDSVSVWGPSGETYIPSVLFDSNYAPIGVSGNPLKVSVADTGISFSFSVNPIVGVTTGTGPSLRVQGGSTSEGPIYFKFYDDSTSVPVRANTNIPVKVDISGSTGLFESQFVKIKTNTDIISTISDKLSSNTFNVKVLELATPRSIHNGTKIMTSTAQPIGGNVLLKSGITVKSPVTNKSTIFIGNSNIQQNPTSAYPLEPGESIFLQIDNLQSIWSYASINPSAQKLIFIAS
jgi:hypothetical protein